ncbi:hypothetical protein CHU98_g8115, partial [Xylaria longipes]
MAPMPNVDHNALEPQRHDPITPQHNGASDGIRQHDHDHDIDVLPVLARLARRARGRADGALA